MKKLLLILLCLPLLFTTCKKEEDEPTNTGNNGLTYVPDDNFEQALINEGLDNVLDNYVSTTSIDTVTDLNVDYDNIADLTGIADFTALRDLDCQYNNLTSLDVSQNINLTWLNCGNNEIANLNTGSIDIATIYCHQNNITNLNLSNNHYLRVIYADRNNLTILNLKNGNSANIVWITTFDNPNLSCILVDDPNTMGPLVFLDKDPQHYLSNSCP